MAERIQKLLADQGLGSRREIETWISAGLVKVNGVTAKLGDRATLKDKIEVRGRLLRLSQKTQQNIRVIMYNKPIEEICSRVPTKNLPTVFAKLPQLKSGRWVMIGRLDVNTSGLLLFTTDGKLAHALMHPLKSIEREYVVRVKGSVDQALLQRLTQGVMLADGLAKFDGIEVIGGEGSNQWYKVILTEGRNREVRRLWESQNCQVSRLKRSRFGEISLPKGLRQGQWRELMPAEMNLLYQAVNLEMPIANDHKNVKRSNIRKPRR